MLTTTWKTRILWIVRIIACILLYIGGSIIFQKGQDWDWELVEVYVFSAVQAFPFIAFGFLLFGASLLKPKVVYICIYIFLWLITVPFWYQPNFGPRYSEMPFSPWYILLPILGSLLLAAFYKPLLSLLNLFERKSRPSIS